MSIIGSTITYEKFIGGKPTKVEAVVVDKFRDGSNDNHPGGDIYLVRALGESTADTITPFQVISIDR